MVKIRTTLVAKVEEEKAEDEAEADGLTQRKTKQGTILGTTARSEGGQARQSSLTQP